MQGFFNFIHGLNTILIIIIIIFLFFAFVALSQINSRLKRMNRRYNKLLRGRGELDLEGLLSSHSSDIDAQANRLIELKEDLDKRESDIQKRLSELNMRTKHSIQNVGFHRYNAFEYSTNELSFSLALLDEENTGVIVTSIYGSENTNSFAKEVVEGRPLQELSIEEELALGRALKNN